MITQSLWSVERIHTKRVPLKVILNGAPPGAEPTLHEQFIQASSANHGLLFPFYAKVTNLQTNNTGATRGGLIYKTINEQCAANCNVCFNAILPNVVFLC